jgi:hypothetical protein
MLQVYYLDVAKVDPDVAYVAISIHVCYKSLFQMFYLFLYVCCKCFTKMLHTFSHICRKCFYLDVVYVCNGFQVFCKCYRRMLQVF